MNGRKWHFIKRNHGTQSPSFCLFVDTEAQIIKPSSKNCAGEMQLERWAATVVRYNAGKPVYRKEYAGDSTDTFWELVALLVQPKKPLWVIGHNVGFDLTLLEFWELIEAGGIKIKAACLQSPPLWIEGTFIDRPLRVVDSFNYFNESLESIGDWLGIKKLHPSYDACPEKERAEYCRRDCAIVEAAMSRLFTIHRDNDMGVWKYTLGGISWQLFRHKFLDTKILVHCNPEALTCERRAYYGGPATVYRQESFFDQIFHVDVNSLYPSVMVNNQFPIRLLSEEKDVSPPRLKDIFSRFGSVALCLIESESYPYPVFDKGRVRYANGKFITALPGPELEYAYHNGHLKKIIQIHLYEQGKPFTRFVRSLFSERMSSVLTGDDVTARLYKLIMNSLYGKFAQRGIRWKDDTKAIPPQPWGHYFELHNGDSVPTACRSIGWHAQIRQPLQEGAESCPIISAYVTSYGRLFMQSAMELCGRKNVMYSDCDSLHVNRSGFLRLKKHDMIEQYELGKFKLVAQYSVVRYYGPKRYEADDTVVYAGRKKNARQVSARKWRQDEIEEVQSVIARQPNGTIRFRTQEKSLMEPSFDGRLQEDGTILPPWIE